VPILLYCRSGSRTTSLGNALIDQLGFSNVTHLTDGIIGWQAEGQDTVSYQPE
jgi:rhodanese-related sulfurtransferase